MSQYQRIYKAGLSAKKKSSSSKTSTSTSTSSSSRPITPSLNSPAHNYIMYLQRTIGNRAVEHLWKSGWLQRKLNIGPANDKYEQEADTVAEKVVSMDNPEAGSAGTLRNSPTSEPQQVFRTPLADSITPLQRKCASCEKEEAEAKLQRVEQDDEGQMQKSPDSDYSSLDARERDLQRRGLIPLKMPRGPGFQSGVNQVYRQRWLDERTAPPRVESSINTARGGGRLLSPTERSYYEPRFGTSFSGVKIHTDSKSAQLSRSVNAKAFTVGRDIFFGAGEYSPNTVQGKKLMAHELTHTVQQGSGEHRGMRRQVKSGKEPQKKGKSHKTQSSNTLSNKIFFYTDDNKPFQIANDDANVNVTACATIDYLPGKKTHKLEFDYSLGGNKTKVIISTGEGKIHFTVDGKYHQIMVRGSIDSDANSSLKKVYDGLGNVYNSLFQNPNKITIQLFMLRNIFTGS